jgi:hypothetical protein
MRADDRFRPLPVEAVTLLSEGQFVQAIKAVREHEGLGLREAKRRVDAWLSREPLIKAQIEMRQRAVRRKFFLWFLLIDVVVAAAVIYWLFYRDT